MNKWKSVVIAAAMFGAVCSTYAAERFNHNGTHTVTCIDLGIWGWCVVKPHLPHPPTK